MELTREEAIRLHRELWKWLAENPMKRKEGWPGWDKIEPIRHLCPCCEYVKYDWNSETCKEKCPLEWKRLRDLSDTPCLCSYFKDWERATAPEERSKYAALIRDLPERKPEVKQEAKYPALKIGDWVKVLNSGQSFNKYVTFFGENNLEQFAKNFAGKRTTYGESYQIVGIGKNTAMPIYGPLYVLQARDGQVYIMHNGYTTDKVPNPSLELTTAPPKYSVGDKVVPVSKSIGIGLDGSCWKNGKKQGFLYVSEIRTPRAGDAQPRYGCWDTKTEIFGDGFFESDLIPYVEPPKFKFKVGDKVVPVAISWPGWDFDRYINSTCNIPLFFKKNGYLCVSTVKDEEYQYLCGTDNTRGQDRFKESELIPYVEPKPLNLCPEPKTITESVTYKFKGNKTTCIIDNELGRFVGVAKCSPQDEWKESRGMALAKIRALEAIIRAE